MSGPRGEDPVPDAEIDRRFAELVERYYRGGGTGQPDGPARPDQHARPEASPRPPGSSQDWRTGHPLFQLNPEPDDVVDPPDQGERYVPQPMEPMPRLSRPALVGSLMLTTSALMGLLAVLGLPFPPWAGLLAITGFTLGMIILLSRLPRHRDPEDGDGAVL